MSFFDSLDRFVKDLQKSLKPKEVLKLRSCKNCNFYKRGYCTQTSPPTRVLSEYYAQGCIFYTVEEAVKQLFPKPEEKVEMLFDLPFKDIYHEKKTGSSTTALWTTLVPDGEVWEINTVWSSTTATNSPVGTFMRQDKTGAIERYFHRGSGAYIQWSGKILLPVDNRLRVLWDTIGTIALHVIGAKRYAPT